ncbi:MAG TPA: hypothetical protein VF432_00445 [Thermoanaerobaculia bacterium]
MEVGVLVPGKDDPLSLVRHRIHSGYRKLIERERDDNVVDVETGGDARDCVEPMNFQGNPKKRRPSDLHRVQ